VGSLDDGNKSRIISYRDQEKGQIPSRIMVRLTGTIGAILSTPNTWTALQTFAAGINSSRYTLGNTTSPATAVVDFEAQTTRTTDFTTPSFNFNDLSILGASFSNGINHVGFAINGNKQPTTAVPNGTGGYTSLFVNQNCVGVSPTAYCGSTEMQTIAKFNNLGSQNAGNIWASNPVVIVDAATACQFPPCGAMSINSVLGEEIDLAVNQAVSVKEALRIVDLSSGFGVAGDANNSAAIQVLKGNPAPGWPIGLSFNSDFIGGGRSDLGYPISPGGKGIVSNTTGLQLQCFLCLDGMAGGFSEAAITLPTNSEGVWFGADGSGGRLSPNILTLPGTIRLLNVASLPTVDLNTTVPTNGFYASGGGAIFSNCPQVNGRTQCLNGTATTYSAFYLKGTAIHDSSIAEYMRTFDCNLNAGKGGSQVGSFNDAKACLFVSALTGPNAGGSTWGQATDLVIGAGDTGGFKVTTELDITNNGAH
jgi:hypothetical protein